MRRYGYCRSSNQTITLPDEEYNGKSKSGGWLEKRRALMRLLLRSGTIEPNMANGDLLFVEMSTMPMNRLLQKNWGSSGQVLKYKAAIENAKCPVIVLLDDPDIACDYAAQYATEIWVNASKAGDTSQPISKEVDRGQRDRVIFSAKSVPFHFHSLIQPKPYQPEHNGRGIYFGKGELGRNADLVEIQARSATCPPLDVYGEEKHFNGKVRNILPMVGPAERHALYAQYGACLALRGSDHLPYGFHTGRKWHAFLAGSIALSADEYIGQGKRYMSDPALRRARYDEHMAEWEAHRAITMAVLQRWGLV